MELFRLRVDTAVVRFAGGVHGLALRDGFGVGLGEIVAIVGPNGAGKSLLLDVISGFRRPTEGCLKFWRQPGVGEPRELSGMAPAAVARCGVRRTFQRAQAPLLLTARECISYALGWNGRRRVDEILDRFQLRDAADKLVRQLSIGQRRLVDLACALSQAPLLALLDEPFAALADSPREAVWRTLRDLAEAGSSVVLVEHDGSAIERCDRSLRMENGRLAAQE